VQCSPPPSSPSRRVQYGPPDCSVADAKGERFEQAVVEASVREDGTAVWGYTWAGAGCQVGALWGADLGATDAGASGAVAALGFVPAGALLTLLRGRSRRVRQLTAARSDPQPAPHPAPTSARAAEPVPAG
jgi:hypothetical protein